MHGFPLGKICEIISELMEKYKCVETMKIMKEQKKIIIYIILNLLS